MTSNIGTPMPTRRPLDTLFGRLLLAQAILVVFAAVLFAALVFVNRSLVLAELYAELLAPELASATGGTALPAPPRAIERLTEPDTPAAMRITAMPGVRALMHDLGQRGVRVDEVALETRSGAPLFWLRVLPASAPSPAIWVGVEGQSVLPDWSNRLTLGASAVLLLVGVASWAFARRISRPLEHLRAAIESQEPGRDAAVAKRLSVSTKGVSEVVAIATAYAELQARLQRYERERKVLLGGISHDLRSPLARIRLAAEMQPECEDNRQGVQIIVREVEQADRLVDSFLDFVLAGELALDETVDLAALARAAAAAFDHVEHPPVVLAPARLEHASANALLLERVIINLIDNAFKHGRSPVRVTVVSADDGAHIIVEDRGAGMDPDKALRMQEAFARGTSDRGVPGTGLGLAIVLQVIQRMGGQLSFERLQPGQRVSVKLPPRR
jgi:two-component system osmolarity sensor histidine kinase EnvZ